MENKIDTYKYLANDLSGYIDWESISVEQELSEDFILEFSDKVDWEAIAQAQTLSESFIEEFIDKMDIDTITQYQTLSEDFIRKHKDDVDWYCIAAYQVLSEEFIREYKDYVDWDAICQFQVLSEGFIREFSDEVNWMMVSEYQILSEDFIQEFMDKMDIFNIARYQVLSEGFIRKSIDKTAYGVIAYFQKVSNTFLSEFGFDIDSNSYLDVAFKKKVIETCGEYECYDDYFIAYKIVRKNYGGIYKPGLIYNIGETYSAKADISNELYSFGFHVCALEKTGIYRIGYTPGYRILKVKIYYKDVASILQNGKIRASRLTVLGEI